MVLLSGCPQKTKGSKQIQGPPLDIIALMWPATLHSSSVLPAQESIPPHLGSPHAQHTPHQHLPPLAYTAPLTEILPQNQQHYYPPPSLLMYLFPLFRAGLLLLAVPAGRPRRYVLLDVVRIHLAPLLNQPGVLLPKVVVLQVAVPGHKDKSWVRGSHKGQVWQSAQSVMQLIDEWMLIISIWPSDLLPL